MWRRIWVLEFNRRFTEEDMDRQLEVKLLGELSGIFNWALDGYRTLKAKKFALSEPSSMKMSKKQYRDDITSDSITSFEKKCMQKSDNTKDIIIFSDMYDIYVKYCMHKEQPEIQTKNDFKKKLKDIGYIIKSSTRHGNKVCVFNVKLNMEK